jgi:LiaF transmembrane domain
MRDPEYWERRSARREARMQRRMQRHNPASSAVMGVIIIAIGALFLLQNLGILYINDIWSYWPVILIAMGVGNLASGKWTPGTILTTIGAIFLLKNLGFLYGPMWEWRNMWPLLVIAAGVGFLLQALSGPSVWRGAAFPPVAAATSGGDVLNVEVVFGGPQRQRIDSQNFEGGVIKCVFSGLEIDLRDARTTKDEIVIKADAVFGGIDLWVPENWKTTVRGTGVFGAYLDKTHPPVPDASGKTPRLLVTGGAVFGGVTVNN